MVVCHGIGSFQKRWKRDMTSYEIYVFILCLIVFILLTAVFTSMLIALTKQSIRLIRTGTEDKRIYKEYIKSLKQKKEKKGNVWFEKLITGFFLVAIFSVFALTVVIQTMQKKPTGKIPSLQVVYSDSMSAKYEKNTYLFENNLNNHFNRFDLVVTHQLPAENDLQLYDIVVYEVDDVLLIHRIVAIEEPNAQHPNERYFLLQGDLVENPDKFPVRYSQMKAVYRGERIQFVGSFVLFLQSPAGYLCFILIAIEMLVAPRLEKKLTKEERLRLAEILKNQQAKKAVKAILPSLPIYYVPTPYPVPPPSSAGR